MDIDFFCNLRVLAYASIYPPMRKKLVKNHHIQVLLKL
jgi:hypothetical protein